MSDDKLVRMANQIATFFRSYPEVQAQTGIRDHIRAFWTPKMRALLDAQIARGEIVGLDPLVVSALRILPLGSSAASERDTVPADAGP